MRLQFSLLLLFVLPLGCQTQPVTNTGLTVLKIYHTNDIHAHLSADARGRGGIAYLAGVLNTVRQHEPNALILDAGDFYKKGSLPSQNSKDEVTSDLISHITYYDARAAGNNELKVGIPKFLEWAKTKEKAPLLSSNFVDKDSKPVFKPWIILNREGLKIGIIGMTPKVPIEENIQAPSSDPRAPYALLEPKEVIEQYIKELRPQVDVLILLSHNPNRQNLELAKIHPEIDLVVSGHSHVLTGDQKKIGSGMVVEAGQFGEQVGVVTLVYDGGARKVASIEATSWPVGQDFQLADGPLSIEIRNTYAKWAPDAFTVYGQANDTFTVIFHTNPYEGTLNDWVADLFKQRTKSDIGITNRELFRENIFKGKINRESIFLAEPYVDAMATITISTDKLEKILKYNIEENFNNTQLFNYGFSGITTHLQIEDHQLKKVDLHFDTHKKILKVALPYYITTHCSEFFHESDCPLPQAEKGIEVRDLIIETISKMKKVTPPKANRVIIQVTNKAPPPITAGND